jgi:signal transduction histidine kinase
MRWTTLRPAVVASMLGLTTIFAAVLTAEAVSAARSHRIVAERVLHDYTTLGAEGVAQRLRNALNGRFSTVLLAAAAIAERRAGALTASDVQPTLVGNARDVLDDSSRIIRVVPGDSLSNILAKATAALPGFAYFGMMWTGAGAGRELLVFQPVHAAGKPTVAFTLPERAAAALVSRIVARDPVLPASLTHGADIDSGVGLRVTSAPGDLANRRFQTSAPFQARVPLEQPYGDLAVEVSLRESLAPALVIGGLPRSRVPLLVALLVLTIGLTVAAGDQLRRELELSRLRHDFVSSVSHELRTPLAHIRMFAETLRLGRVRSADEEQRSLTIIENEARRLEHLVENVLLISRAERRALEVHPRETNLTSLMQEVVAEFVPLAAKSESRIALDLTPNICADVDPSATRQIVLSLLDNAVKYGRRGQVVTARLLASDRDVRIEVEDQGAGIAAEDRPRIWERFWRSASARQSGIAGTGIGLAIVNDLVRLHGGSATASASPAGGARITILLPRRRGESA